MGKLYNCIFLIFYCDKKKALIDFNAIKDDIKILRKIRETLVL